MNRLLMGLLLATLGLSLVGGPALADTVIATFDETYVPNNPLNTYGSFTHGQFNGAVTDGPTSLTFDVLNSGGDSGAFGGIGVDYGTYNEILMGLLPLNFNAAQAYWEVRLKLLPNNEATAIRTSIRDMDTLGTAGDEHVYEFNLANVPNDGNFHSLFAQVASPTFSQTAYSFQAGDGLVNPGFDQLQIQSVYGATGRLNVEIDHVTIWQVPEPSALVLAGLVSVFGLALGRRR
jgi:hypothetical protein